MTDVLAKVLDGPAALRRYLIKNLVMEGVTLQDMLTDDEKLEAFVRKAAVGVWHASCTCRMGGDDDPMAVTDPAGRVRGGGGAARGRCLGLSGGAVRQHQFPGADDGGEDGGCDPDRSMSERPRQGLQCRRTLVETAARWSGCIAQLVEQLTLNQRVVGSNLTAPTTAVSVVASSSGRSNPDPRTGKSTPPSIRSHVRRFHWYVAQRCQQQNRFAGRRG